MNSTADYAFLMESKMLLKILNVLIKAALVKPVMSVFE